MPYFQKLLRLRGFEELEIGFILAAFQTVGILAQPLWGWLSDRSRHRRRLIALGLLGGSASFLAFGWITAFWVALAAAFALGFFYRPIIPLTDGLVLRYLAEHGGDYGRPRTAGSASFIGVILVMEWIGVAGAHGQAVILGTAAACAALTTASVAALPLTERERTERAQDGPPPRRFDWTVLRSRAFVAFALVAFLSRVGMMGYYSFFTLFLQEEIGFQEAGYLWTIGTICEIPVIFFSTRIIGRIGVRNMFALGTAGAAVRLVGFALAPTIPWMIPLQLLHSLTFGAFHTASIHYLHRIVPQDMKQSAVTIFAALSLGSAAMVGSALGGALVEHLGYRAMFGCFGMVAFAALAGLFLFVEEPRAHGAPA